MVNKRLALHEKLCELVNITEPDGDRHVYFDPPASVKMKYPAIRYSRANIRNKHANNLVYSQFQGYELVVIDKSPDSSITAKVSKLPKCSYVRSYKAENLNHDVFNIND